MSLLKIKPSTQSSGFTKLNSCEKNQLDCNLIHKYSFENNCYELLTKKKGNNAKETMMKWEGYRLDQQKGSTGVRIQIQKGGNTYASCVVLNKVFNFFELDRDMLPLKLPGIGANHEFGTRIKEKIIAPSHPNAPERKCEIRILTGENIEKIRELKKCNSDYNLKVVEPECVAGKIKNDAEIPFEKAERFCNRVINTIGKENDRRKQIALKTLERKKRNLRNAIIEALSKSLGSGEEALQTVMDVDYE
jgi:hypothetical protein